MSASLVGSEMCIRDSHRNTTGTPQEHHRNTQERLRPPKNTQEHPGTPVSYTHLTLPTICSV
eukprot:5513718-Alexandrium_andersonii.AAC.1